VPGQIYWIAEPASAIALPKIPSGWQVLPCSSAEFLQLQVMPALLIVDQLQMQQVTELAAHARHSIRVLTVADCQDEQLLPYLASYHLFYPQPLQGPALKQLIAVAKALAALALPADTQAQLLACTHLPVLPPVVWQLQQLLQDPDVRIDHLAAVAEQDPVLCARLLQLANSAYMGFQHDTASMQMAISRLGLGLLYGVLLALCAEPASADGQPGSALQLAGECRRVGQWLGLDAASLEQVVLIGLFYQLGQQLLLQADPAALQADAGQAGAFMLTLWGLQAALSKPLLLQQTPDVCRHDPLALCLYLARQRLTGAVPDAALGALLAHYGLSAHWPSA